MRPITACFVLALSLSSAAQQNAPTSKQVTAVREKAEHLAANAPISVVRVRGPEEYGNFLSKDQDTFTFYDVDIKKNVTLSYVEVRKIKDGHGGYNTAQQRHTDHTKAILIAAVVLGGLAILIGAAAAAH
jgi:outer membrane lipoprotein-sorting protein